MADQNELIITGQWPIEALDALIRRAASISDAGERIEFLSRQFLGTDYQESTLIGSEKTDEVFVINLAEMDCFTFLDYVEAMRLSSSFTGFTKCLKKIRYHGGIVSFRNRNHFFTDWPEFNGDFVKDVTAEIGVQNVRNVRKVLNLREAGGYFVPGIKPVQRDIRYILSSSIGGQVIGRLKTGDYIGIYSGLSGLDVSHVGIFIREGSSLLLRHASSSKENRQVVDQDFLEYMRNKSGIIVFRPKS